MAQVNELNVTSFQNTGQTTAIARYTFVVEVRYIDDAGVARTYGPTTHTYPNDLASMPLTVRRKFAIDMIDAVARVSLGLAQWSDYE